VKLGLLPHADLQLGFIGGAQQTRKESGAPVTKESGVGDTYVRVKWNLWGNDDGPTALAVMPFVILPAGHQEVSDGAVTPGLIVPFGWAWPAGFDFGGMVQVDWAEDADEEGRHAEWLTTATVGHALAGSLGAFLELAATTRPAQEGDWIGTVDVGLIFAATPNVQLDLNVSGVDGVRAFGEVGPVGAHLSEQRGGGGSEEMVAALGRRLAGKLLGPGRAREEQPGHEEASDDVWERRVRHRIRLP